MIVAIVTGSNAVLSLTRSHDMDELSEQSQFLASTAQRDSSARELLSQAALREILELAPTSADASHLRGLLKSSHALLF